MSSKQKMTRQGIPDLGRTKVKKEPYCFHVFEYPDKPHRLLAFSYEEAEISRKCVKCGEQEHSG